MNDIVVRADDEPSKKAAEIEAALKADKARKDAEGDERFQTLCDAIQDMSKGMASLMDRMDAFEKSRNDSDLEDIDEEPGKPRPMSVDGEEPRDMMLGAQAKADAACVLLGMKAPPPMVGERLLEYRKRLLRPLQQHSTTFKDADLDVASVDDSTFNAIEGRIYADAVEAGKNPAVAPGFLIERSETRGGHTYTNFYGDPRVWLDPAGHYHTRQAVTGFGPTNR